MILNLAFVIEGFAFWFFTDYSYEMRFVSQNIFFMLVSMAILHHVYTNMPPCPNSQIVDSKVWITWAFVVAVAITWLFIGQKRAENIWLRWAFSLSWTTILILSAALGEVSIKEEPHSDPPRDLYLTKVKDTYKNWARLLYFTLALRVL